MQRRITMGLVAVLALLLAACEINVNYDLLLNADGTSEMEVEVVYDQAAAGLLGPPEAFLSELEEDTEQQIEGIELLDSSTDGSDADAQKVRVVFRASHAQALNDLVADNFSGGSYTEMDGDVVELVLFSEDVGMGDMSELSDMGMDMDMDFMSGSFLLRHDGSRQEVSGAVEVDAQTLEWDPFGPDDLRVVIDLSAGGSAPGGGGSGGFPMWIVWLLVGLLVVGAIVVVIVMVTRRGGDGQASAAPPMGDPGTGQVQGAQAPASGQQAQWAQAAPQQHGQPPQQQFQAPPQQQFQAPSQQQGQAPQQFQAPPQQGQAPPQQQGQAPQQFQAPPQQGQAPQQFQAPSQQQGQAPQQFQAPSQQQGQAPQQFQAPLQQQPPAQTPPEQQDPSASSDDPQRGAT